MCRSQVWGMPKWLNKGAGLAQVIGVNYCVYVYDYHLSPQTEVVKYL